MIIPISKMRTVNLLQLSEICFKFQETCQQRLAFEARIDKCLSLASACLRIAALLYEEIQKVASLF